MLFRGLPPYKGVFVGLGLDFRAVNVLHIQCDESFLGKHDHQLCEHLVDLLFDSVAETVDGVEVGLLISGKPYKVYVTLERRLNLPA